MNGWSIALPIITLVLGYFGTLFTESRRDARQLRREEVARNGQREMDKSERREAFELAHLDTAYSGLNAVMVCYLELYELLKRTYANNVNPDDLDVTPISALEERTRAAQLAAWSSIDLLLDNDVRASASTALRSLSELFVTARSVTQVEAEWAIAFKAYYAAEDNISSRVRQVYGGSSITAVSEPKK